ncbi:GntR family transcriptional regulator [Pseudoduganella flava]|uniref:Pyruvate dehydrogenase complex repressor n=1 Tax=Pseudoduganella flava TaxID=871742 RepID=A0A562Q460_9BURK|nr:FCD domain-containing protein [Pseudoduganella flava]QGZ41567.1 FCD domain-containing protein [Pseudoduganella flava]TWI51547.1 GntR family transcriptional regulator [Pseudoduganella flava]
MKARLSDAVTAELERRILEGMLKAGDRLPAERELALELGVSRPSLRVGLQALAAKGMLVTRHGGGTFVTEFMQAPFVDPWQQMLAEHPEYHGDVLEFRHMLEAQAAALAAQRATDDELARIGACFTVLQAAFDGDDLAACIAADVAFHQAIADASHNVMIGHLSATLHKVLQGHVQSNLETLHARPELWQQLREQHAAVWQAVRTRRHEAAGEAARQHIGFIRETLARSASRQG